MRILNISAQKPNSTGSGVYMTELMKSFNKKGIENAAVCGIDISDKVDIKEAKEVFPVYFNTEELPFPVVGMSDSMPYEATRYRDMTPLMQKQFEEAFINKVKEAVKSFKPDIILCHHLYFLTSLIREHFPNEKIGAVCHGTDLRQFLKINLQNDRTKENIRKLDAAFALHDVQRDEIIDIFDMDPQKVFTIGTGYNSEIFCQRDVKKDVGVTEIIYAGKICEKKGVLCLVKAFSKIDTQKKVKLSLAGGYSHKEEYDRIVSSAKASGKDIEFLGKLSQDELAERFNRADIFVLPSFFEGLPLVLAEALACNLKVLATDLPGVKTWIDSHIPHNGIVFIEPPVMENVDEPQKASLEEFTKRLKACLEEAVNDYRDTAKVDTTAISWDNVSKKITDHLN